MSLNRKDVSLSRKTARLEHRHFCAIAEALRDAKPHPNWDPNKMEQWQSTINSFIVVCKASNGRFDAERFLAACNYEAVR